MEKRDQHKGADASGLSAAFSEFVINAQADELKQAIEAAGMEPDVLARQGRVIAERVVNRHRGEVEESARQLREAKALREGLSALLQLLRRREDMSQDELASAARVEPEEIRQIESDSSYTPNPRTIYQLEQVFRLPARTLVKLSGATKRTRPEFAAEVLRFAANARGMSTLTYEEKKLLNEFVMFLSSEEPGKPK